MSPAARLLLAMIVLSVPAVADASAVERLLMPGPVAQGHAKWEDDCTQCHDRQDRGKQTTLCLACHKDIRADLEARRGLHGHESRTATSCRACHTEHKGRGADITGLDRATLDHARTGYELTGKHAAVGCQSCHAQGKPLRQAPTTCHGCHQAEDVHKGKLGTDCGSCHTTSGFRVTTFDHGKTRFALLGAHTKVSCVTCHREATYKGAPLECVACHHRDDVHHGGRGPNCAACHTAQRWKESKFDHERIAHFALHGQHAEISCDACHRSGDMKAALPKTCVGCHAADDRHGGRFGTDCAQCHDEARWKNAHYDHAGAGHFPLLGAHEKLECHACHKVAAKTARVATACIGCHRSDDVHHNSLGEKCQSCHNERGWKSGVVFDHDITRFPLVALHATVACEECHASRAYREARSECYACHASKDVHKGGLGRACGECHNPNGWKHWQFDHGAKTRSHFALAGRHAAIECKACHRASPDEVKLPTDCASCHTREDVHQGRFGNDCGRCHDVTSFKQPRVVR
jgi:hypothetical protein